MTSTSPPCVLSLDTRQLQPADVAEGIPSDPDAAERLLRALLVGQPPGARGRLDVLTYPDRRGAHAYRAAACYLVDADGRPVPCAGPGEHAAAIAHAEHALGLP